MEITRYIAADSPARAAHFLNELERRAGDAAAHGPHLRERPEIGPGIKVLSHGRYLIFFREREREVRIERVLPAARGLPNMSAD